MAEWWESFFDSQYYRTFYGIKADPKTTEAEADGVVSLLKLQPRSSVLDLGCGWGRHCHRLREMGFRADGLDYSKHMVARANSESGSDGSRYYEADFRNIPLPAASYDAVISMYTSFGYSQDENDDLAVLREVSRILKPGGQFLIENDHPFNRGGFHDELSVVADGGRLILLEDEDLCIESGRVTRKWRVYEAGVLVFTRSDISWRLYTPWELISLMKAAGLVSEATYGDWCGGPFGMNSPKMIITSRKSQDASWADGEQGMISGLAWQRGLHG